MDQLGQLHSTLEVLAKALRAKDGDKAFEAATVLLLQFAGSFGPGSNFFKKTFPLLEQLKEKIESEEFEEAAVLTDAFLISIREARKML